MSFDIIHRKKNMSQNRSPTAGTLDIIHPIFQKKNVPVILWHCDKSMAVIFLQLIENISTVESVTF